MALLDKIGEFAKIAANKTEEITKTIGEKAEAALEIQKLTSLVGKEESKIESTYKKMGKMVWLNVATFVGMVLFSTFV